MIPHETVNKILDSVQIADVVSDFVSLKRRGANYVACCPFHNEKTPSFYVSPAKGIYKCFGCGKSGTAVGFVMEHESMSYSEALKYLARKYGIEVHEKEETPEETAARQRSESLYLVMDYAENFFKESLQGQEGRAIGHAYFRSRGLEDTTIEKYGLGWAPKSGSALTQAALAKGYKEEFLIATGVSIKRHDGSLADKFYDRVIFPIHSVSGRVIAFGGRTLRSDYKEANIGKYVNSPETEIYDKSRSLYGIYFAKSEISRQDKCYLVEGYLDVLSMHQIGITNVVASSGTSLTVPQIRLIHKFTENVTIMYDGDSAGIHAALRGIGLILKEGLNVRVVLIPDGDDPDSYSRKHTLKEVQDFIASAEQDFITFKTDLLIGEAGNDPLKRANLINDIADTISLIPDLAKRAVYVQDAAVRFGVTEDVLYSRIASSRKKMIEDDRKAAEREKMRAQRQAAAEEDADIGQSVSSVHEEAPMETPSASHEKVRFESSVLAASERDLVWFIVRYGLEPLEFETDSEFYDPEGSSTVADFIRSALEAEEHQLENLIYRKIYDEYFRYYDECPEMQQDDIIRKLMNSPDRELADLAADLTGEKYPLTVKNFENSLTALSSSLVRNVPKAILEYNSKRVKEKELKLVQSLNDLTKKDPAGTISEEQAYILAEMKKVAELRRNIVKRLGRVQ